jgi:hypothetical protein
MCHERPSSNVQARTQRGDSDPPRRIAGQVPPPNSDTEAKEANFTDLQGRHRHKIFELEVF